MKKKGKDKTGKKKGGLFGKKKKKGEEENEMEQPKEEMGTDQNVEGQQPFYIDENGQPVMMTGIGDPSQQQFVYGGNDGTFENQIVC